MNRVKYIGYEYNLFYCKVYDVIGSMPNMGDIYGIVTIKNDEGIINNYTLYDYFGMIQFEDVTIEVRNNSIDYILED